MSLEFTDAELLAYVDELLPADRMAAVENELRRAAGLKSRVVRLMQDRDQGGHSLSEIWRRFRLSCPTREQLQGFLARTLDAGWMDFVDFHVHSAGCRYCAANLEDLARSAPADAEIRRRKIFQSSAGHVRKVEEGS